MRYKVEKMGPHWWIKGDPEFGPIGPYDTRAEAEDGRRRLERFARHCDEPGYMTSRPPPKPQEAP